MELEALQARVSAVEIASHDLATRKVAVVHELDRLAEHLVGESAPELQGLKLRIQDLLAQVVPERRDVVGSYTQADCHVTGG